MSSLQVHETHTAIVSAPGANWTVDYLVRCIEPFASICTQYLPLRSMVMVRYSLQLLVHMRTPM